MPDDEMIEGIPAEPADNTVPGRIEAALRYLYFANDIRTGPCREFAAQGRGLTALEKRTYDSALHLMNQFFQGEVDAGAAPLVHREPEDDEPKNPVKVSQ